MGDGRLAAVPLLAIFDQLHVPEGVWQEAQRPASIRSELGGADRHTLLREEVEEFAAQKGLQRLHGAERESLLLCSKLGVKLLVTDDLGGWPRSVACSSPRRSWNRRSKVFRAAESL